MHRLLSQKAFIYTSYGMAVLSLIATPVNVFLYASHHISEADLILITLILSYLALIFSAYGNVISAQVNKKVEDSQ